MTMPSLIANHKEKTTVSRLKKVYSTLNNAYMLAKNEHTEITNWFEINNTRINSEIFFNNLKPYLSISKICGSESGCFTDGPVKTLDGRNYVDYNNYSNEYRFILSDGTQVEFMLSSSDCNDMGTCGNIKVDIDGSRGSYTIGKDFFTFEIYPEGIYPEGTPTRRIFPFEEYCNRTKKSAANGRSCSAWILINENMDYLHCDDLDWNTKIKCK